MSDEYYDQMRRNEAKGVWTEEQIFRLIKAKDNAQAALSLSRQEVEKMRRALEYAREHDHSDDDGDHENCLLCKQIDAALSPAGETADG